MSRGNAEGEKTPPKSSLFAERKNWLILGFDFDSREKVQAEAWTENESIGKVREQWHAESVASSMGPSIGSLLPQHYP